MHALKTYSYSDDEDESKDECKRRRDHKLSENRETHVGKERRSRHSPSRHSRERYSRSEDRPREEGSKEHHGHSRKHLVSSRAEKDHYHVFRKDRAKRHNSKERSRSRSPVKKIQPDCQVPLSNDKTVSPTFALAQAQAASALLSSKMSQTSQAQLQLNRVKQQSIEEKRKMLWSSKKKSGASQNQWEQAKFSEGDGQVQAKFRRLMGMGSSANDDKCTEQSSHVSPESTDVMKNLEQQYESSRYLTHMARGLGLGYGYSSTDSSELDK